MKLMKSKKAGLFFGFFVVLITTTVILGSSFADGAAGGFYAFVDWKSILFVISVGLGITFMREHLVNETEYANLLKENFILAGWLGFFIGFILFLHGCAEMLQSSMTLINDDIFLGLAYSLLPIMYGYNYGYICEAVLKKPVKEDVSNDNKIVDSQFKIIDKNPEAVPEKETTFES